MKSIRVILNGSRIFLRGTFRRRIVRRKKKKTYLNNLIWPDLTETNIFSYSELYHCVVSYSEKSAHDSKQMSNYLQNTDKRCDIWFE